MNRRHDRDVYFALIDRLRAVRPDIAMSCVLLSGSRESDRDFADTLSLVNAVGPPRPIRSNILTPRHTGGNHRPASIEAVKSERLESCSNY